MFMPAFVTYCLITAAFISQVFIGKRFLYVLCFLAAVVPIIIHFNIHTKVYEKAKPFYENTVKPKIEELQKKSKGEASSSSSSAPEAPKEEAPAEAPKEEAPAEAPKEETPADAPKEEAPADPAPQ